MNFFQCKISYEKITESGLQKKVTEPYLVDALSFTEAEARIIEEVKPFIAGEFQIKAIAHYPVNEYFKSEEQGDFYFRAKVAFISLDERSGSEKQTKVNMLIQASEIQEAKDILIEGMKGTLGDYKILEVKETTIMNVFEYNKENEEEAE